MPDTSRLLLASLLAAACQASTSGPEQGAAGRRALWVTRFDYVSEEDVTFAIDRTAEAGFDTVLFQVRGNATTFYPSAYEPWAEQLGGIDPGFDPLAVAVQRAHERGLELHAWVNVVPAWWGLTPPENREHIYYTKPEWFWYDQHGDRQALSDKFYVSLNPCLPEVREYLTLVIEELVVRYELDGLHLDYIRFPNEPPATPLDADVDYPRDARTLGLYQEATGLTPDDDAAAWDKWRTEQVTQLVRDIRSTVHEVRPGIPISAAVGPEPARALHHFQDVAGWLDEGLLDAVYPMNYTAADDLFESRLENWAQLGGDTPVVMGLRLGTAGMDVRADQIHRATERFDGFSIFAYSTMFDSPNESIDAQTEERRAERTSWRERFVPIIQSLAD